MYFGPDALDVQVETYIKKVRELLAQDDAALTPDNPLLQYITLTAPTTLVSALDQMVRQYQQEGEASIGRLQEAETIFWIVTLLLLMLEAALIFHPFTRHIRIILGQLQSVTDELQLQREHLEESVIQRTAELESRSKELIESEHRYRTLVENSPFCIHEIDLDGRLQSMNRAGLDMMGLDEEQKVCGLPYLSAVSEQDSGRIKGLLQDALNGKASHFEFAAADFGQVFTIGARGCALIQEDWNAEFIADALAEGACEGDAVVHDGVHMLGGTEHVHQVDLLRHVGQSGIGFLSQHFADCRAHRNDAIPLALQSARHAETGPRFVRRQTDDRNGVHLVQQLADFFGAGIGEGHGSNLALGGR